MAGEVPMGREYEADAPETPRDKKQNGEEQAAAAGNGVNERVTCRSRTAVPWYMPQYAFKHTHSHTHISKVAASIDVSTRYL